MNYHLDRLAGYEVVRTRTVEESAALPQGSAAERADFPEFYERWRWASEQHVRQFACTGPISYSDLDSVRRDIDNLQQAANASGACETFMTALSPAMVGMTPNLYYPDEESYHMAVCDAMKEEYELITNAGIVLQIDSPDLGLVARSRPDATIDDHRRQAAYNIELVNLATRDIDPDMIRVHVCWGADDAPHHRDTPLEDIVDVLLRLAVTGSPSSAPTADTNTSGRSGGTSKSPRAR